ncbi:LacI family transcriptional regulator [Streptomyces sp. NBC_00988]|uniref:LacI family DNA-binding transcriptional regulator n=1 Tax=Streptomyces sp. NBC_00988 TaxID=2903704 RepID=UPI0038639BDE|nr:LacI family transcriptional regulator [Streptomyces sp. NBC_00988]
MQASIYDVAKAAGVSASTVSRVLSGARAVRPESAAAVAAAVEELGYRPNQLGRALRKQSTQAIGMIVPRVDNPFFPSVVQHTEESLRHQGYALLLCTSNDDPDIEAQRLDMLTERQVDGVLISPCHQTLSLPAVRRAAERIPLVQLDRSVGEDAYDFVGVDDTDGIRQLVDHLRSLGKRDIAYVGGDRGNWSGAQRHSAFLAAIDAHRPERVLLASFSETWGREAAEQLLTAPTPPDAIVCGNDLIAHGVITTATRLGLRVPHDLAVSGYDDISTATLVQPSLTTVRQPVGDLTAQATDLLLARIDEPRRKARKLILPTRLIVRGSTTQAGAAAPADGVRVPAPSTDVLSSPVQV